MTFESNLSVLSGWQMCVCVGITNNLDDTFHFVQDNSTDACFDWTGIGCIKRENNTLLMDKRFADWLEESKESEVISGASLDGLMIRCSWYLKIFSTPSKPALKGEYPCTCNTLQPINYDVYCRYNVCKGDVYELTDKTAASPADLTISSTVRSLFDGELIWIHHHWMS